MKKYKKTRQRRKKYKKASQRKVRDFGHSQPSFSTTRKRAVRALVIVVIVCTAAAGFVSIRYLWRADKKPETIKQSSNQAQNQVLLPVRNPLRTEQEFAALKKEELELAEKLISDFLGNENAIMIMGNVWNRYGDAVEALKLYKGVLEINPKRDDVYAVMGGIYLAEGKFEEAIGNWQKALEIQPQLPNMHSNVGHALMMLGRRDEAIRELETELQISPNSSLTYFLLGQTYLQEKDYTKAKENYEMAVKINPEYANAYYGLATVCTRLGNRDKAKEYSEKFKGLKSESRKDLKGRKILYDDFVETQKLAALTFLEAGQMYRGAGKLHEAEELLKQAAGLDPENVSCLLELASLYQDNNQPLKALQIHKKTSEIEPDNAMCHFQIGILSFQLKLFDDAEEAFRKVITLAPQQSAGYRELAGLYLKTGKKFPQARQIAEKAVSLEATAANYFVLSWACDKNGDTVNALSAIKRAVKLAPGNQQYLRFYNLIQQRN
ncbi:MAG: tetratricopeptide repeat protein [Planctomycetota bacterium]|jgi:tetratricopeptide (TPR) repeat protein